MAEDLRSLVEQLKSVSHPLRLRLLALLGAGELCVCQLAEALAVPTPSVSEALRELRRAGFVNERKEGRWTFMSIKENPSPLLQSLLQEAKSLPEVCKDRASAAQVKAQTLQSLCQKYATKPEESSDG